MEGGQNHRGPLTDGVVVEITAVAAGWTRSWREFSRRGDSHASKHRLRRELEPHLGSRRVGYPHFLCREVNLPIRALAGEDLLHRLRSQRVQSEAIGGR